MKEDANQRLVEGHRYIVAFLKNWQERLDSFIQHKKQQKLLQYAIDNGLYPYKEADKRLKKDIGETRSARSKVKSALNESLRKFCKDYQITPPIQLYFVSAKLRKQIIHFACCRSEKTGRAAEYVSLDKLQETLIKAYQLLVEDSKEKHAYEGSKIIVSVIKQLLRDEALLHLREKLRPRDESDYKPLQLDCGLIRSDEDQKDKLNHNRKWGSFDFNDLLKPFGICVLACDVGTGKTTFLRYLQLELLQKTDFIPIFVHARKIEKWEPENSSDFAKYLAESFHSQQQEIQVQSFLEDAFNNKNQIVLMVDGLDQIRGVGTEYKQLIKNVLKLTDNNLIIASRPSAVTSQEGEENITFLRLKPFDTNTQKLYFGEHYKRARELSANAPDLIAIPMLAYMVRTLIEKKQDKNIKHHTELYKRFIDYILEEYEHEEVKLSKDDQMRAKQSLRRISYDALTEEQPWIQKIPLEFCYEHDRLALESDKLTKFGLVNLIVERTEGIDDYLYFTHQSFQEYLAAEWVMKNEERIQQVLNEMWKPKWREVIKFLAGFLGEDIIKRIYPPGCKDNCIHSRLFLAAECCGELDQACELERPIFNQLKELIPEPLFEKDVFISLSRLNSAEVIDFLVSLATGAKEELPGNTRNRLRSLAIKTIPTAQSKVLHRHIDCFLCSMEENKQNNSEIISMLGKLFEHLSDKDINKIIELTADGRVHSDVEACEYFAKKLSSSHIERIFKFIACGDDNVKLRFLTIIKRLIRLPTTEDCDVSIKLEPYVETLFNLAKESSRNIQEVICTIVMHFASKRTVPSHYLDWVIHMLKTADETRQHDIIAGIKHLSHNLSPLHLNQIFDFLNDANADTRRVGMRLLNCLEDRLSTDEVPRIMSLYDSKTDSLQKFALELLEKGNCSLKPDQLDKIIDLLLDENKVLVAAAMRILSYFTKDMEPEQEERILNVFSRMKRNFKYTPLLCAKIPNLALFEDSFCPISKQLIKKRLDVVDNLLSSRYSIQRKIGIELLVKLGDDMERKYASRIVNLLPHSTQDVIEKALFSLQIVPQKLSNADVTEIIGYLGSRYFGVRQAARTCLISAGHKLLEPHIRKIEDLLAHQGFRISDNVLDLLESLALLALAGIREKLSFETIKAIILIPKDEKFCLYYSGKHARMVWSDITKFASRFEPEHTALLVDYVRSCKYYLKIIGLEILDRIEQVVPNDVFYEIIEYAQSGDFFLPSTARSYLQTMAHTLKQGHVQEIVKRYEADLTDTEMYKVICAVPPELLDEYLGLFITFLDHQDVQVQHYVLDILIRLVDVLEPHIKRIEKLLHSTDENLRTHAYKFLKKTYELHGVPQ